MSIIGNRATGKLQHQLQQQTAFYKSCPKLYVWILVILAIIVPSEFWYSYKDRYQGLMVCLYIVVLPRKVPQRPKEKYKPSSQAF